MGDRSTEADDARSAVALAAKRASAGAAEALAALLGQSLTSESRLVADPRARAWRGDDAIAARFDVQGMERSGFVVAFPRSSLRGIRDLLAPGLPPEAMPEDAVALELGNICVSHFLNALGDLANLPLLPTPPAVSTGDARIEGATDEDCVVETHFRTAGGADFVGFLLFRPGSSLVAALGAK